MPSLSLLESVVPDAMLLGIASYLEADELISFELVSKKFRSLSENLDREVWQDVCHRRWSAWPRYRWKALQKSRKILVAKTWKQRYLWVEADYSRTRITEEELEMNQWYFNFTPEAGWRGSQTLTRCFFECGYMILFGWPNLRCQLKDDGHQQILYINDFPPHTVERLSNGEWVIQNENIICVSSHEGDTLTYRDRGFQS